MSVQTSEFDYEAIVEEFIKKGITTEYLENKKDILDSKLWSTLEGYFNLKSTYDYRESTSNIMQSLISSTMKTRNRLDEEHAFWDQKLEHLQQLHVAVEIKKNNQIKLYFKTMEKLYGEMRELPQEFDNENMHTLIGNLTKSQAMYQQEIDNAYKEMEGVQSYMEKLELTNPNSISEIIAIIQKHSLEQFGNSMKMQNCLSDMRQKVDLLSRKVQDIHVKYDI